MKLNRTMAVALLLALGFTKAGEWDDTKLAERVGQVPSKVDEGDIPEEYSELYDQLVAAEGKVTIVSAGEGEKEEIDVEILGKSALKSLIEDRKLPVKFNSKTSLEDLRVLVAKALAKAPEEEPELPLDPKGKKVAPAKAPVKPAPAKGTKDLDPEAPKAGKKEPKPAAKPVSKVAKDGFGCKLGTISSKVNGVLTKEWQDESTIVETAGVTVDQARGRLYYAAEEGIIEYRRLIQYRLKAPVKPVAK